MTDDRFHFEAYSGARYQREYCTDLATADGWKLEVQAPVFPSIPPDLAPPDHERDHSSAYKLTC